ncbi:uncharacterized protein LOC116020364 [Ipomoea triloba]|uniref:uncharacterized protein LOC116020364 n=1 Tax=Ipomoea triloba TaxID=35885 RepID=UPI00125E7365|nr:uncharacterized protein LOC116020364 [Ipomoea triloba]
MPPPWASRLPAKVPFVAPFTPLKARPSEILAYAEECQLVKPTDQGYVVVPDQGKYFRYHRWYGHSTNECQAWRKEIETLIQSGQLGNYIDWNRMHHKNVWKRGAVERPCYPALPKDKFTKESTDKGERPVINVIFGGWSPVGAEEKYVGSVEKPYVPGNQRQESITFSNGDLPGMGILSRDALVISMGVNGTEMRRVLVDTGSGVTVMYYDVFVKLGFAPDQLRLVKTQLAGFTRDTIEIEGSIRLPVELGVPPNIQEVEMDFVVVRITCAHNIILGRPWLSDVKGIISMKHLCLKFHTPKEIGVVRGD